MSGKHDMHPGSLGFSMPRPQLGSLPGAATFADEARLSFLEGLRVFNLTKLKIAAAGAASAALKAHRPASVEDVRRVVEPQSNVAVRNRFMRTMQQRMWQACASAYEPQRDALTRWMSDAESRGPGSLRLDPSLPMPGYYAANEFHIQPGSYFGDELAGPVYHYGTKIFYLGMNDADQFNGQLAHAFSAPEDNVVSRVLDLGCSIGQSATALALRFPAAEVTAIDLAAPMLRYAHARAVDLGLGVDFRQADATRIAEPDGSYDIVHAMILFHELPVAVRTVVVAEAARLLRPGGRFVVVDFPHQPATEQNTMGAYDRWCDSAYNGEPFAYDFVYGDFAQVLEDAFGSFDSRVVPPGLVAIRTCTKA